MTQTQQNRSTQRYGRIRFVLIWVLVANLAVSLSKGVVGWSIGSISMVADAFHSLMDGSANVIGLIGISLASRPQDESHTYGHNKFETFASLGIVVLLLITAMEISRSVWDRVTAEVPQVPEASTIAFAVMFVTIGVNITISVMERRSGRRLKSNFLVADSRHTLSDVWVSLSVIASLVAARLDFAAMDAVVGGLIALVIGWAAINIMREASVILLDRAALNPADIEKICLGVGAAGVLGCHKIRTRGSESGYWIDLHLLVEPDMTTRQAHGIASKVERALKESYGEETDTVIHIEPGR